MTINANGLRESLKPSNNCKCQNIFFKKENVDIEKVLKIVEKEKKAFDWTVYKKNHNSSRVGAKVAYLY